MIPVTSDQKMLMVMMLCILSCWEGTNGLKPAQAHCCLPHSFVNCSGFILYTGLSQLFSAQPMLVWSIQDSHTLLMNSERKSYITSSSIQLLIVVYLKQRPPSGPLCAEIKSDSLHQLWSVTACIISQVS